MRLALGCAAAAALVVAPSAAALPRHGTLVPDRSLGGVRLGESGATVAARLGGLRGTCRGCVRTTWYFTYRRFDRHGLAVELTGGRVSAVYTLWQPAGWTGPHGLALGVDQGRISALAGALLPIRCGGYSALVADGRATRTAYYVVKGRLWGFGLFRAHSSPCR